MLTTPFFTKLQSSAFLRESFAPVIMVSLLFHGIFFAGIILLTKALYKSKEFERPYTFELIRLSEVFTMPVQPAAATPVQRPKSGRKKTVASAPAAATPQQIPEKSPVPSETKTASPAQQVPSPPVVASASVSSPAPGPPGPAVDSSVSTDRVYDAAAVDEPPVLQKRVDPFYPEFVKDQGISGTVKAQVVIDRNGSVIEINVQSSPHELLTDEVYKAVSRWKYKPAKFKGVAVKVRTRDVRIEFQLTD